jgi:hypothetical protein
MTGPGDMTPREWEENEARRRERRERADHPHGRPVSEGARTVVAAIVAILFLGLIAYAILGWLGVIPIPGITTG